ncbi:MAG: Trp biosynthesis-associated membrane protein [Brachybacterium sp.]|nr:Trp biosynthesis-associated membrane protein [Brachybacterium sp.]MDN5898539.1 Trp biosynthesis-associated membrane protein [Brachybacterium sp.]
MSAPEPVARRGPPGRRTTVLAGTAASVLLAGTTRTSWIDAAAPDLTGTAQQVDVLGADAAPAVLALALVAIAASLATSLSSAWLRFLTGPVLLVTGAGAAVAALGVVREPGAAAGSAVTTATGVVGSGLEAETTAWPLLSLVPALAVLAVGALVLLTGGTWPRRDRYRSAAVTIAADPAEDPAAAWDALTRGEDPSVEEPEAPPPSR